MYTFSPCPSSLNPTVISQDILLEDTPSAVLRAAMQPEWINNTQGLFMVSVLHLKGKAPPLLSLIYTNVKWSEVADPTSHHDVPAPGTQNMEKHLCLNIPAVFLESPVK